jgi:thiol:disulfide interchange protein
MKITFLTVALLASLITFGQEPVTWKITASRKTDSLYELVVKGNPAKGWHIYADIDTVEGLEPVILKWDNELVLQKEKPKYTSVATSVRDPLFANKRLRIYENEFTFTQSIQINVPAPGLLKITVTGFASNGKEFLPLEEIIEVPLEGGVAVNIQNLKLNSIDLNKPASSCGNIQSTANKSLLAIFMLGLAGGLLALLTPCVFPMIPVTVSVFTGFGKTKKQGVKNGLLYGVSILLIYLLASVPFHLIGNINPQVFNTISTNAWVNLFFFAIFLLFALSFFGVFHIKLPAAIANSTGSKGGIFFMALTLAIVSFSCTGPILGSLLVGSLSSEGGAWQLTAGMGGFGAALALPFALFAMFPGWLKTLPKSGPWMDTVKKSLAFAELALALKFLSNADLVMHWGLLKREVFIAAWMVIALALAVYLFGFFQDKFEGSPRLHVIKEIIAIVALIFAGYLFPGLTNTKYANLKLLSGFPPPLSYSIYHNNDDPDQKGLVPDVINDYDKALALAKAQGKPLLIDFTGWACVNCRKMEEQVWTKPAIAQLIKDKFILVSLYVDDRKKLPAAEQFIFKGKAGDKDIKTIGDKWATLQQENFNQVTQPLYVVLSPEEKLMNNPVGYTPSAEAYSNWLDCGLAAYEKEMSKK